MDNNKIEKMLYEAQEKLPTTNLKWKSSDLVENQTKKKIFHMNNAVAACIAVVMFLSIGGITVLANMEIDIDSNDYGQWYDIRNEGSSWKACEKLMKKRSFVVPENFDDYKYTGYNAMLVAKHGDTYWDALTKNVYNPVSIEYAVESTNQFEDEQWIDITLGMLDEVYWSTYFGFENVDGEWIHAESDETLKYRGMAIYGKVMSYRESGENMNWRWIDEKKGICWCVTVPMDEGIDSLDVVKTIIDLN